MDSRNRAVPALRQRSFSQGSATNGSRHAANPDATTVAARQQLQLQQLQAHQQRIRNLQPRQPQSPTQLSVAAKTPRRPSSPPRYRSLVPVATSTVAYPEQTIAYTSNEPLFTVSAEPEPTPVVLSIYETDAVYGGSVTGRERLDQLVDRRDLTITTVNDTQEPDRPLSETGGQLGFRFTGSQEAGDDVYGPRGLRQQHDGHSPSTFVPNDEKELPPIMSPSPNCESPTPQRNFSSVPDIRSPVTKNAPRINNIRNNLAALNIFKILSNPFSPPSPTSPQMQMGQPLQRSHSQPNVDFLKMPPRKVVKAVSTYLFFRFLVTRIIQSVNHIAENPEELSYKFGDFFYVIRENSSFYEVSNPLTQVTGLVPKYHFASLEKSAQAFAEMRAVDETRSGLQAQPANLQGDSYLATPSKTSNGSIPMPSRSEFEKTQNLEVPTGFASSSPLRTGNATSPVTFDSKPDFSPPKRGVSRSRERKNMSNNDLRQTAVKSPDLSLKIVTATQPQQQQQDLAQMICLPSKIKHLRIQTHLLFPLDNHYYYKIEYVFERPGNVRNTIYRTHEDFWSLQVYLLNSFPHESGRQKGSQRLIPFLPILSVGETNAGEEAARVQKRLECYLRELLHSPLPIINSSAVARFFTLRTLPGVVEDVSNVADDVEDTPAVSVLSMLNEYDDEKSIRLKLDVTNSSIKEIELPRDSSFQDLLDLVGVRLGCPIHGLAYKDELGTLLNLAGDRELKLLLETFAEDVIFFPV
ncbi:bud emergence protein 1 [Entophlyctis sp. JEL0112]|nr:bud emergence protein 1 [Entophlyctis sp. JEL0112]